MPDKDEDGPRGCTLFDFLDEVRRRPGMYLRPNQSLDSLADMIYGYGVALAHHGISEENVPDFDQFAEWLERRSDWALNLGWARAIRAHSADDAESLRRFFELAEEFRRICPESKPKS